MDPDSVVRRSAKESIERFTDLVKHTYRVLFTRGLSGCYVYFQDEQTRDFFLSRIEDTR
ncbi:MAG: DNA/RNA helicase domain-containing protein [Acidimicrobiia bacterium]